MQPKITVAAPHIRLAQIKVSVAASTEKHAFYDFRSTKVELPLIRTDVALLLYRMANFRTYTDQQELLAKGNLASDYFQAGQENASVQQIQHGLLAALARRGRAESVVPVIDVLRSEKQREPLLITSQGVVVNGNRRLAAMRELLAEDEEANSEFRYVTCLVLPEDATAKEIVEIEAGLQGRPETKLDYDWIGDAQLVKRLQQLGWSEKQISERLRRRPAEIRNALQALTEADLYLKDWRTAPDQYSLVRESEQFFKDLPGNLQGKSASLADGTRAIAWTLYDNRDQLGERLYAYNTILSKRAAEVAERAASQLGIGLDEPSDDDAEPFSIQIDDATETSYQPLITALRDKDRQAEIVDAIVDVSRSLLEEEKGKKTGSVALKVLSAANAKLMEVDLSRASPDVYRSLEKQLDQIGNRANALRDELATLILRESTSPDVP